MGMKFEEAWEELQSRLHDPDDPNSRSTPKRQPTPADNQAAMAMLMSQVAESDFKGARR